MPVLFTYRCSPSDDTFNFTPPVRPTRAASLAQPLRLPGPGMGTHDLLRLLAIVRTVHTDERKRNTAKSQRDQTTTLWRNHVILALRNSALNDLDLPLIEPDCFIQTARLHVRCFHVSQQDFCGAGFHDHITDSGIEDV